MKVGDEFPVLLDGHVVGHAKVEEIDGNKVTLLIPARRVVMGVHSTLTDLEPEVEHVLLGAQEKPEKDAE